MIESLNQENEGGKKEEKKSLLEDHKPLRIEPKRETVNSKETIKISPKEEPKEGKPELKDALETRSETSPKAMTGESEKVSGPDSKPAETGLGSSLKEEKKSSPLFFRLLFTLSLILVAVAIGLLLLPILGIPVPDFLTPAIDFAGKLSLSSK